MAGERTKLVVANRERLGSAESRRMRKEGLVPGVLYGNGEPVAITIAERELRRALTGAGGLHSILDVEIDGTGKAHASILKDYQVDKVRGFLTHVDLQEVRLDQPIEVPEHIDLDVSGMEIGGTLRISDLTAPEGATLLDDPEMVVATVTAPTKVVEPEPTEEELAAMEAEAEAAEGEEGEEGEAAEGGAEPEAEASGDEATEEG